ncbi:rCOP11 protein [Coccidioides immitis RMSCC 3703]|uniref:RCOP11 protein n=1 Tax=Coccidioides immitis RMSCC 3703 TaxID=454286 RepID=A0A0J8QT90_COCIT|nr:rCOP11 protein [Coccidioides immitis RMSCC 3703]
MVLDQASFCDLTHGKSSSPKSPTSPLPREDFTEAVVDDPPKFDLESYLSNYEGSKCGPWGAVRATEALKLALVEARSGKDVKNYQKALEALVKVAPSETDTTLDKIWVEQTLKSVKADTDRLEHELRMWASLGLSQLATGAYFDAAMSFVSTDPNLGDNYKEIISANDIAVYGGLCAMASMDRSDLVSYVLENKSFRNFLELEPHIRRAVSYFCSSKFRPCLEILESYRGDYLLDIHLHNHVHHLYSQIRTKAILQYIVPYNRIALRSMANVFSPKDIMTRTQRVTEIGSTFLLELLTLIQEGILDAQVDLERDVLISRQKTIRYGNHQAALDSLNDYMNTAHLHLVHLNILHAGLDVPDIQQLLFLIRLIPELCEDQFVKLVIIYSTCMLLLVAVDILYYCLDKKKPYL